MRTLAPMVQSADGTVRRDSETLPGALREQLDVLRKLDTAGLGEGAGYKILRRAVPRRGNEHFMLAMIPERGHVIDARSQAMLTALNPAIREAVLRLDLPLVAHEPILAQIVEEQSLGYVCVSLGGALLEANRRAYELILAYRDAAHVQGRRGIMIDFAARARRHSRAGKPWILVAAGRPSVLEVHAHRLACEAHALPEDVVLLMMKETHMPSTGPSQRPSALDQLTPRQREIALLFVSSSRSYKQIADQIGLHDGTVRKHAETIYRVLGVHSRGDLAQRLR
jgi:DNA-binding CsgD family transcriptional regulator